MSAESLDGYIYILSNPAMPGLLKVGRTAKDPFQRARELYTTGVPAAFHVEAAVHVADVREVEFQIHKKFSHLRHATSREFFTATLKDVLFEIFHFAYKSPQVETDFQTLEEPSRNIPWPLRARELLELHGLPLAEVSARLGISSRKVQREVDSSGALRVRHPKFGEGVFMQGFHEGERREVLLYFPGKGQKRMLLKTSGVICLPRE